MKKERIAVIDLGTNTFHLLIADVAEKIITSIYSEKIPVKIGKGGINEGYITDEAIARALDTMNVFKKTISEYNVSKTIATATSAFRNARNGKSLALQLTQETGIDIHIISGDREAELIYFGVREALVLDTENTLIVDIGGGSVEFIIATSTEIFWKQSFEIGGQRLMELFQKSDPIAASEIDALKNYLHEKLAPLREAMSIHTAKKFVGSSGSFDTLSDIDLRKKGVTDSVETRKSYLLPRSSFESISQELMTKDRAERMKLPGMIELRVDMIVVATVLIDYILHTFSFQDIQVSTYALKEGLLSRIIEGDY